MYSGLNDWKIRLNDASRHFRNLWHWSDSETDKLGFQRLNEILSEAKESYPDYFDIKKETEDG